MPDPLRLVFALAETAVLGVAAIPVGLAARALYRRRAARRNARGACGQCGGPLLQRSDDALFVVEGRYVCAACATTLRRRLRVLLPVAGILAVAAAVSSAIGALAGGPGLEWWVSSRLIPLIAPSALLAGGALGAVWVVKWLNRRELADQGSSGQLPPGAAETRSLPQPDPQPHRPGRPPQGMARLAEPGA